MPSTSQGTSGVPEPREPYTGLEGLSLGLGQGAALPAPWFWTCDLQNCEEIKFWCCNPPICGICCGSLGKEESL